MRKWVYMFTEGNASMRELLGGKGANLAEMTNLGLPVPQGLQLQQKLVHSTMRMDDISIRRFLTRLWKLLQNGRDYRQEIR